jgi:hypothetical protein
MLLDLERDGHFSLDAATFLIESPGGGGKKFRKSLACEYGREGNRPGDRIAIAGAVLESIHPLAT